MGEIHDSTTGSLVSKNQLLGKIRIYDYDFFTWQQRYLTELGNAGRRRVFLPPLSGAAERLDKVISTRQQAGELLPDVGGPIALPRDSTAKRNTGKMSPPVAAPSPSKPASAPANTKQQPQKTLKPSRPSGIPPGVLYYGESSPKDVPTAEQVNAQMERENRVPDLPTGSAPELPTGSGTGSANGADTGNANACKSGTTGWSQCKDTCKRDFSHARQHVCDAPGPKWKSPV